MRTYIRSAAEFAMGALPRKTKRGDRLVLAYHNVVPNALPPQGDRSLHLSVKQFEEQLRRVKNEADIVPLSELLWEEAPTERRVSITFDDAYASAMTLGVEACVAVGVACTVFVAPALLGTIPYWDSAAAAGAWSDDDRQAYLWKAGGANLPNPSPQNVDNSCVIATLEQLSVAAMLPGVTLGNHTMHHINLGAATAASVTQDIADAQIWLHAHFEKQLVPVVAYPYGIPPREPWATIPSLADAFGLLVSGGWAGSSVSQQRLGFPRWNVPSGISARGFSLRLRGWLLG